MYVSFVICEINYSIRSTFYKADVEPSIVSNSFDPKTKLLTGSNDLNLVNLFLRTFGRCTEPALCIRLLIFQVSTIKQL